MFLGSARCGVLDVPWVRPGDAFPTSSSAWFVRSFGVLVRSCTFHGGVQFTGYVWIYVLLRQGVVAKWCVSVGIGCIDCIHVGRLSRLSVFVRLAWHVRVCRHVVCVCIVFRHLLVIVSCSSCVVRRVRLSPHSGYLRLSHLSGIVWVKAV